MRYTARHERHAHDGRGATTLRFRRYRREIRELSEQLRVEREARLAAETANAEKDRALAAICHDLRTPLSAVLTWAQVARSKSAGGRELDDAFGRIEAGVHTQAMLINDILDLAKSASGTLRIDRTPVDLRPVVAEALSAVEPIATTKNVEVEYDPTPVPATVRGDARRLQQVVWNLVTNGVKFTPAGGRVVVIVRASEDEVTLRVSDTGRGIDPAFLPRIFERFEQHVPAGGRDAGGTGLGLAIVCRLVELHGGRVRAESAGAGLGAAFTVSLPRLNSGDTEAVDGEGAVTRPYRGETG
jgi:signal transduction histidine kinase